MNSNPHAKTAHDVAARPTLQTARWALMSICLACGLYTSTLLAVNHDHQSNDKTHYATIDDRQIAYRKTGSGPPVILLNRFRGTLDTWDPAFINALAKFHTLITFDYPGIGYSEGELPLHASAVAAEVIKLASHLELETFDVLGWSYGGLIAQYVAFLHPESVGKAVLVGTNPLGQNAIPMEPVFAEHALKPQYDLTDYTTLFFEPASDKSSQAAMASMERTWPGVDRAKVPMTQEVYQRYIVGMRGVAADEAGLRGKYATTEIPLLAISGDHDISFSVANWYPLLQDSPTLQLVALPDAGHAPHFQYPELTTGYITAFLR